MEFLCVTLKTPPDKTYECGISSVLIATVIFFNCFDQRDNTIGKTNAASFCPFWPLPLTICCSAGTNRAYSGGWLFDKNFAAVQFPKKAKVVNSVCVTNIYDSLTSVPEVSVLRLSTDDFPVYTEVSLY